MSEPFQLVLQCRLSRHAYEQFLAHRTRSAVEFGDWLQWLSTKDYHGPAMTQADVVQRAGSGLHVATWLREFSTGQYAEFYAPVVNRYDDESGIWTFAVFGFSENYGECIEALNLLRQISDHKDAGGQDYLAIVPWLFGAGFNAPEAVIEIGMGASAFVGSLPATNVAAFEEIFRQMAESQEYD
jgi:hypothetical protein